MNKYTITYYTDQCISETAVLLSFLLILSTFEQLLESADESLGPQIHQKQKIIFKICSNIQCLCNITDFHFW